MEYKSPIITHPKKKWKALTNEVRYKPELQKTAWIQVVTKQRENKSWREQRNKFMKSKAILKDTNNTYDNSVNSIKQ